jgi:hypothetical protein
MHTRILMILSAALMGAIGLVFTFIPQEVLALHGTEPDNATVLLLQMAGAVYLGFALLNWAARGVLIGGIYSRPVAAGNFFHFVIAAATLGKAAITFAAVPLMASAAVFTVLAVWFGLVMFRSPV